MNTNEYERTSQMINFSAEVEIEDEKRRQCTAFGYKHGGSLTMGILMFTTFIVAAISVLGLLIFIAGRGTSMSTNPLFWVLAVSPFVIILPIPFLFLKLKYALRVMMFVIALYAVLGLAVWGMDSMMMRLV